ncbi:TerB family tellurite resistance protein [Mesorhizobium sp. KR9-304]|uniref:tellurite resistance TerB family protein n=1 Tax=Mesorhizobium sp. KR9-304 TaxID=3156614 RepID=UPI0032B34853
MFDRILAFLKELPAGAADGDATRGTDDPRVAAAALMYHVMDADGVRHDAEWERMKKILAEAYDIDGEELDKLVAAGGEADEDAIDLYAFTSVLKRDLDEQARIEFIGLMWEIVFADGELHELEDHTLWRIAELIGVDRRDRILQRKKAEAEAPDATGKSTED